MTSENTEVDISHVTRPELIIQPDLTAICVPVMERQEEGMAGCWRMHLQHSYGSREVFTLPDVSIRMNGRELFFFANACNAISPRCARSVQVEQAITRRMDGQSRRTDHV